MTLVPKHSQRQAALLILAWGGGGTTLAAANQSLFDNKINSDGESYLNQRLLTLLFQRIHVNTCNGCFELGRGRRVAGQYIFNLYCFICKGNVARQPQKGVGSSETCPNFTSLRMDYLTSSVG